VQLGVGQEDVGRVPILTLHEREGGCPSDGGEGGGEYEVKLAAEAGGLMWGEDAGAKGSVEFVQNEVDAGGVDVEVDGGGRRANIREVGDDAKEGVGPGWLGCLLWVELRGSREGAGRSAEAGAELEDQGFEDVETGPAAEGEVWNDEVVNVVLDWDGRERTGGDDEEFAEPVEVDDRGGVAEGVAWQPVVLRSRGNNRWVEEAEGREPRLGAGDQAVGHGQVAQTERHWRSR
jgi:hypothetical protein